MLQNFDRTFLFATLFLITAGFLVFTSASLGLLARETSTTFVSVTFKQAFFGIFLGVVALLITSNIRYRLWRTYAFYIFIFSLILTALVFVPGLGQTSGGATRWLSLGSFSFQPAELLKLGFVLYLAAWLAGLRAKTTDFRYSIIPFCLMSALAGAVLLKQPDTGTYMVLVAAGLAMLIAAGARWRDIIILCVLAVLAVGILAQTRPYVKDRLVTFIDPGHDPRGSSYQIQQSLIAIGSGGLTGRGFGQSIQKFNYLPEPTGDSIFAVAAEEFGFAGSITLVGLFLFLGLRGLKIAARAPDMFGRLTAVGIVILIISQSFINIGSMLGVLPLTGLPMLFVSHGGSAMVVALAEVGILLNISRYATGTNH